MKSSSPSNGRPASEGNLSAGPAIFFPGPCFREGMETHRITEQEVRIYNAPKTVIDCFRWRNTVGLEARISIKPKPDADLESAEEILARIKKEWRF